MLYNNISVVSPAAASQTSDRVGQMWNVGEIDFIFIFSGVSRYKY